MKNKKTDQDKEQLYGEMIGSLLRFTQIMYYCRTGRKFDLSQPVCRESHYITICKELTKVINGETKNLIINVPPRYGKSELVIHFVAWALAQYQDSNFIYVSYSHSLAQKQTQTIRDIITLSEYRAMFNLNLREDINAKDNFETDSGGSIFAAGAGGTITGRGAGIKNSNRFGGAIIIDDIHKPDEVTSDTIREKVNNWYYNTLQSRINSPTTPIIFIGQRLHEDDLAANLIKTGEWRVISIPALDNHNNVLHSSMHDFTQLMKMKENSPYEFSSQYQQNPQPAGGGIFKKEWFYLMDEDPEVLSTFITADTAETDKSYNDATVFSFWGIYKIKDLEYETEELGLHWINSVELRIEPKDLKPEFMSFYRDCMIYKVKPKFAAIEKKSTGTTLISLLKDLRGIDVREIERTRSSGSKISRFLEIQPFVAKKLVSLNRNSRHTENCIEHMSKITANDTHRFDDIADTLTDACKIAFIDKIVMLQDMDKKYNQIAQNMMSKYKYIDKLRSKSM